MQPGGGTLIHGDQSFRIWVNNQPAVDNLQGVTVEGPGFSFDGGFLPIGRWGSISFQHNGFNQVGGGYSYPVPAVEGPGGGGGGAGPTISSVPAVGPQGVLIGNRIGYPAEYFHGDIARVMVWRIDPQSTQNEFLARPLDHALSECWTKFLTALDEALRHNPRCAEWLQNLVATIQQDFLKALAQKSPAKIDEFRAMCRTYRELWRTGNVGRLDMLALIARLRDWLKAEGLFSLDDPKLMRTMDTPCLRALSGRLPPLDCDPDVQALIQAILGDRGGELNRREGCSDGSDT